MARPLFPPLASIVHANKRGGKISNSAIRAKGEREKRREKEEKKSGRISNSEADLSEAERKRWVESLV